MTALGDIAVMVAFALCASIAVAGALGMATTMSMFRSGIFLMASFIGVAGLFILLAADLMALLQIMMYIGGMLVMILFMVLFMEDPGGAMMASMTGMMTPIERFFSGGLQQEQGGDEAHPHQPQENAATHEHEHEHGHGHGGTAQDQQHGGMQMDGMDMSMTTPVRKYAAWLAAAIGVGLAALLLLRPAWHVSAARPDPRSAEAVGKLLMGKYMVAFEASGFLILMGIFGAVLLAHVKRHPADGSRGAHIARAEPPAPIEPDTLAPASGEEQEHGRHAQSADRCTGHENRGDRA